MKFRDMPYKRPELETLRGAYASLTERFPKAASADEQYVLILEHEKLSDRFATMETLAEIRQSINTTDPFYEGEVAFFDENEPLVSDWQQCFYRVVADSQFRAALEEKTGAIFFKNIELALRSFSSAVIDLCQRENALTTEYENLLASAKINFQGGVYNLSEMQKFTIGSDRAVRKAAWEKIAGFFTDNAARLDALYDELVQNRTEQAHRLGYENFVQLGYDRLGRNCYGPEEIAAFRKLVVRDVVPVVSRFKAAQAKRLGVDHLMFWDDTCQYPDGNPKPVGDRDALVDAAQKMYREMSPQTGEFFDFMKQNELFDLESKKGKAGGGYCTSIPDYHSPFIFSNFNGTAGDVDVLTHEAGHAFADYTARANPLSELRCPTMDGAETHSMSMELFSRPWDNLFFGDAAERFHVYQLETAFDFIPYGTLVDHFQTEMYEHPELTPAQRHEKWLELEHLYRPWIDFGELPYFSIGGGWQRQHHIYSDPLYYIDYCLAQTTALEFWTASEKDWHEAFSRYLTFVQAGGTKTYLQLCQLGALRSPFEDGTLRDVGEAVEKYTTK